MSTIFDEKFCVEQIPAQLKERPRWLAWRYGRPRPDGKRPKIPFNVRAGKPCNVTDAAQWSDFDTALATIENYDGLGFALNGDGIVGIDVDDCLTLDEQGRYDLEDWTWDVFESIPAYWELSPSGRGLRGFAFGNVPEAGRRKDGIEVYGDRRFLTVTGKRLELSEADVCDCSEEVLDLYNTLCAVEPNTDDTRDTQFGQSLSRNNEETIQLCRSAANRPKFEALFDSGAWQASYNSQSEADAALCAIIAFYTRDAEQIDRIFRQSKLYRPKWERADYREQTIRNALERQDQQYGQSSLKDGPVLIRLSDVQPEDIEWFWPGRLAAGKLSLWIGDPGVGKSTVAIDAVCRISQGAEWPDGEKAPLGSVILLASEDGLADTIRPRVDAHNGDASRIQALRAVRTDKGERPFSLDRDLQQLEAAIQEIGDVKAILIDALSDYLGNKNTWKDTEIRSVLVPLKNLAEKYGIAVIGIVHLSKNEERKALYRALGSIGFVALARTVFAFGTDNDPERRIMACAKSNLGPFPPALAFSIVEKTGRGVVEWESEPIDADADSLLSASKSSRPTRKRETAEEFLRNILANGEVAQKEILQSAKEWDISETTLQRAKKKLGVKSRHDGQPGEEGCWLWSSPVEDGQQPMEWAEDSHLPDM